MTHSLDAKGKGSSSVCGCGALPPAPVEQDGDGLYACFGWGIGLTHDGGNSEAVSTARQGHLGLEAQREAIARFAEAEGFEPAGEFVEVETGKGADALDRRPQRAESMVPTRTNRTAGPACG
jgi:hypothetical protein